ncbi:MAG: hypothetical protein M3O36_10720 [Myxococcota bacterium]|nr:hypothetical protein [Myxococcota bacterium]
MRTFPWLAALMVGVATGACTNAGNVGPSVVTGTAALSTFPSTASSVRAIRNDGQIVSAALASDGRFSLTLNKGYTYKLAVGTSGGFVPLAFPRQTGRIDASFVLSTNGAVVALGNIRYLPSAPKTGFKALYAPVTPGPSSLPADCVDCVNDDQQTSCDDGSRGETSAEPAAAEQANPTKELVVADRNPPAIVNGCDAESGDEDNVQQEGEH